MPSGTEHSIGLAEPRGHLKGANRRPEDTPRPVVRAEPAQEPSAITIMAESRGPIRRAEALAWARRVAAEGMSAAVEVMVVAGTVS